MTNNEVEEQYLSFKIEKQGRFDLDITLFHNNKTYRKINLDLTVIKESNHVNFISSNLEWYLAKEPRIPMDFPKYVTHEVPFEIGLMLFNIGNITHYYNITIDLGPVGNWLYSGNSSRQYKLEELVGLFNVITISADEFYFYRINLVLEKGIWEINISLNDDDNRVMKRVVNCH